MNISNDSIVWYRRLALYSCLGMFTDQESHHLLVGKQTKQLTKVVLDPETLKF